MDGFINKVDANMMRVYTLDVFPTQWMVLCWAIATLLSVSLNLKSTNAKYLTGTEG